MSKKESHKALPLVVSNLPTEYGTFRISAFDSGVEVLPHVVLDNMQSRTSIPNVRIHSECMTGDVFHSLKCDCGEQLAASLAYIKEHGGVLIYLRQEGRNIGLVNKLKAYNLQEKGLNTIEANHELGFTTDLRTYEDALAILHYFEIKSIHLLTNNPEKLQAFENSGIAVEKRIPIITAPHPENENYIATKRDALGHLFG